jgi:N-acetylglucosamine repressor
MPGSRNPSFFIQMRRGIELRRQETRPPSRLKIKRKAIANLEAELLRRVRAKEGVSRVDLARQLSLAPSTVGAYVDRLITEGFLSERQKLERDFGRPPTLLGLNPEGGRFIGVDFDAHNIMATVVDFSLQPMRQIRKTIRPSDSVEQIIGKVERAVEELMNHHPREVLGIGVGVPGTIDAKNQIALHYDHIPGWENIHLGSRLARRFKMDIHLENNIRSMALAELWFGQGRGLDNFICLGIRTGVSAGIITRGRLLHGRSNSAGEIRGWLCPVTPIEQLRSARPGQGGWNCERLQPLEHIVSMPAIMKAIRDALQQGVKTVLREKKGLLKFEDVAVAARLGDEMVCNILNGVAQTLGWVTCQLDVVFNPQRIILAGPLVTLGEAFLGPFQQSIKKFCFELHQEAPIVVESELGSFNGALGAAALALHEWKPKR